MVFSLFLYMKVIDFYNTKLYINKIIPFKGFLAMQLFSFIFMREEYEEYITSSPTMIHTTVNHENIHKEQIKDFGILFKWCPFLQILIGGILFYLIYFFEWIGRLITFDKNAYKNISFEQEAYKHERDFEYIQEKRKPFAFWCKDS